MRVSSGRGTGTLQRDDRIIAIEMSVFRGLTTKRRQQVDQAVCGLESFRTHRVVTHVLGAEAE